MLKPTLGLELFACLALCADGAPSPILRLKLSPDLGTLAIRRYSADAEAPAFLAPDRQ